MKEYFKRNFKTLLTIVVCIIALSLLTEVLKNNILGKEINNEFNGKVTNIYNNTNLSYFNQIKENNTFTVTSNDPMLIFSMEPKEIGSIILYFSEPITELMNVQVFYALPGESFGAENTKYLYIEAGTKQVIFNIPIKEYASIRIDIGDKEGLRYKVEKIETSNKNEKEYSTKVKIDLFSFIIILSFYSLVFLLITLNFSRYKKEDIIFKIKSLLMSQSMVIDIFFVILLSVIFFSIMPILSFDSFWYHTYLDIFNGNKLITDWDPTRGLPFPLLIFISTKLFGYTTQGITITMYIFYLITIFFVFKICKITGIGKKVNKIFLWLILIIFLFLNPIFLGYYHLVLTEFVVSTIVAVYIYILLYTHIKLNENLDNRSKLQLYILRGSSLIILAVISFYIKQMYLVVIILPFIASEILLIINKFSIKRICLTLCNFILTLLLLIGVNNKWNQYIDIENAKNIFGQPFTNSSAFMTSISNGLRYFEPVDLNSNDSSEIVVNIIDNKKIKYNFTATNPNSGVLSAIRYTVDCILESPTTAFKGYLDNYFVIANLYHFKDTTDNYYRQEIEKDFSFTYGRENNYLACTPNQNLNRGTMVYSGLFDDQFYTPDSEQYKQKFDNNFFVENIYKTNYIKFANFLYSFIAFIAFPIMIISFIAVIRKREYFKLHAFNFIYSFTLFFHILQLAVLGSSIDRYAFPLHTLCVLIFFNYIIIIGEHLLKNLKKLNRIIKK